MDANILHEEPPAYGGGGKSSLILKLNWNEQHVQSREEFCLGAGIAEKLACKRWEELELWIQLSLADSIKRRSRGRLELGGEGWNTPLKD